MMIQEKQAKSTPIPRALALRVCPMLLLRVGRLVPTRKMIFVKEKSVVDLSLD
jgi:hypothetical protein